MKKQTKKLIAAGILMLVSTGTFITASGGYAVGDSSSDDINIDGSYDVGIYNAWNKVQTFDGNTIIINTTPGDDWGSGNVGVWASASSEGRSTINLGGSSTETIKINVVDPTNKKDTALGIWALGPTSTATTSTAIGNGGLIKIEGKNLSVTGNSETGIIYGICAQNNSTDAQGKKRRLISIPIIHTLMLRPTVKTMRME